MDDMRGTKLFYLSQNIGRKFGGFRVFIWRLCSRAISTNKGPNRRTESISPICSRCGVEEKVEIHAIWRCPYAFGVWEATGLMENLCCPIFGGAINWVDWCLKSLSVTEMELAADVVWTIWNDRNNVIHGGHARDATEIGAAAASLLGAYREAKEGCIGHVLNNRQQRQGAVWLPL